MGGLTTIPQLRPGDLIDTPDGPMTVVTVERGYRTNFGRWHRHVWVLVEDSDGQRRRVSPQQLYEHWRDGE